MPGAVTPTTVSIGRGASYATPNQSLRDQLLAYIGRSALKAGLGYEGARVAQAIGVTEGGLTGDTGDLSSGGSYGPFQFNAGGQLPQFAAALGLSLAEAKQVIAANPQTAIDWAMRGYLGNAIKKGLAKGLSGSALATFAQDTGQVSESPERAGANYAALFPTASEMPLGVSDGGHPAQTPGVYRARPGEVDPNLVPNQFDPNSGLTPDQAVSACGPAAAVAFAHRWGRNPTLKEAVELAKTVGWDEHGGMNGLANQYALVQKVAEQQGIKIPVKMTTGTPDWAAVVHDAMGGNPVTISTPIHYYVVDGYDPTTGKFHLGQSGLARKAINSEWATSDQITRADGSVNGALFIDHPLSPARSYAGRDDAGIDTGSRDDYRLTSAPVTNTGYGSEDYYGYGDDSSPSQSPDQETRKRFDWWRDNPLYTETGHQRDLDPSAYATASTLPKFDPYQTPGWQAARAIGNQFQADIANRNQSFFSDITAPLYASRPMAPVQAQPAPSDDSIFDRTIGRSINPAQGLAALSQITAPSRWAGTGGF